MIISCSASQAVVVPSAEQFNLHSFRFDDFNLSDDETLLAAVAMFKELNLVNTFKIDYKVIVII